MAYIEVDDGVELFVQDVGRGPTVVFVAGFGLNHQVWDRQVRVLAETNRVVCVDQRGHGRSSKPLGGYDIPGLAHDLRVALERLGVRACTLVGWSFGGQVAFEAAATDQRGLIARLVLIGSNGVRASRGPTFPFGATPEQLEPALVAAERSDRIAARRAALLSGFNQPPTDETLDWLLRISLEMPSWVAVACYQSMLRTDLTGVIDSVTLPVLQITGDRDPVHSAKGARWLQERLANSQLTVIDDCGHYPMLEAADQLDDLLSAFVLQAR
jgi:non-heme chloroperoxidase